MTDTYTASLIGDGPTETIELEFIEGEPQKSFMRGSDDAGEAEVWELIPDVDGYQYRSAGIPGAGY